jgi:hypothetical protein
MERSGESVERSRESMERNGEEQKETKRGGEG